MSADIYQIVKVYKKSRQSKTHLWTQTDGNMLIGFFKIIYLLNCDAFYYLFCGGGVMDFCIFFIIFFSSFFFFNQNLCNTNIIKEGHAINHKFC